MALPIVALLAGVAAFFWFPRFIAFDGPDPVMLRMTCARNLRILGGLLIERASGHRLHRTQGPAFLLQLREQGMIRQEDVRVFLCPLDPSRARFESAAFQKGIENIDLERPDPWLVSYAVRDFARFPEVPGASGKEPWALCPWHKDGANVLFDDGSIEFLTRESLGLKPGEPMVLGPTVDNELLRKFLPRRR